MNDKIGNTWIILKICQLLTTKYQLKTIFYKRLKKAPANLLLFKIGDLYIYKSYICMPEKTVRKFSAEYYVLQKIKYWN